MSTTILAAMAEAEYVNDLMEYGEKEVLDPDIHALSWADLSDDEQEQRKRSLAAALLKAAERDDLSEPGIQRAMVRDWLLKTAEQAK